MHETRMSHRLGAWPFHTSTPSCQCTLLWPDAAPKRCSSTAPWARWGQEPYRFSYTPQHPAQEQHCATGECLRLQGAKTSANNGLNHKSIYHLLPKKFRSTGGEVAQQRHQELVPGVPPHYHPQFCSRDVKMAASATCHHILIILMGQCTKQEAKGLAAHWPLYLIREVVSQKPQQISQSWVTCPLLDQSLSKGKMTGAGHIAAWTKSRFW